MGSDISYDEVDFAGAVRLRIASVAMEDRDVVAVTTDFPNGFHLYAPKALARVDNEVIALVIRVGFGDTESEGRCLLSEGKFSEGPPSPCC